MPGSVYEGAGSHGLFPALISEEEAVQVVDGDGSHDVPVLVDPACSSAIIGNVQADVSNIFRNAQVLLFGGFEELIASTDDCLWFVLSQPMAY